MPQLNLTNLDSVPHRIVVSIYTDAICQNASVLQVELLNAHRAHLARSESTWAGLMTTFLPDAVKAAIEGYQNGGEAASALDSVKLVRQAAVTWALRQIEGDNRKVTRPSHHR